jgi:transcriptional regulator with XRE-family HTH domain
MHFGHYLKSCREHTHLTQRELGEHLYGYDTQNFAGLDTGTISKWERCITQPTLARQVGIVRYFQQQVDTALPCWEGYSIEETEQMICKTGMQNLLGKSKTLILNYPSKMISIDDLSVSQLRTGVQIDEVIDTHMDLDRGINHKFADLSPERLKQWALHTSNSFFLCEYKQRFFGLLFTLRLKPTAFDALVSLKKREADLTIEDFASFKERGSNYILSFFAMNDKAATLLFIRYYAHLIANQKVIEEVGTTVMMEDSRRLIANMHFTIYAERTNETGGRLSAYRESLSDFLASEEVMKIVFSRQECSEV